MQYRTWYHMWLITCGSSQQQCFRKSCNTRFRDTRYAILCVTHVYKRVLHTFFVTHVFPTCVTHVFVKHVLRKRVLQENMYFENACCTCENTCDENMHIRKHMLQWKRVFQENVHVESMCLTLENVCNESAWKRVCWKRMLHLWKHV